MLADRQPHRRLYFFEIFVLTHAAVVWIVLASRGYRVGPTVVDQIVGTGFLTLVEAAVGVAIRAAVEARRGRGRAFWRHVATVGWMTDTLRLAIISLFSVVVYGWMKLTVPIFNQRLFDRQLWNIDLAISGGYSPNMFMLNLFSNPRALFFFDRSYAVIFFGSFALASTFFVSHPSRRVRIGFFTGNSVMWIAGAWLYLLVPSLGPAFFFPQVWMAYRPDLPLTIHTQMLLMQNYQNVLRIARGENLPVSLLLGVGAFPSLHVAFQTYVFLWMRRVWIYGQLVFGLLVLFIVLGSMITGWHYLIDGVTGVVLAAVSYWASAKSWQLFRWLKVQRALAKG